jgi:hypothetical protein
MYSYAKSLLSLIVSLMDDGAKRISLFRGENVKALTPGTVNDKYWQIVTKDGETIRSQWPLRISIGDYNHLIFHAMWFLHTLRDTRHRTCYRAR